MTSAEVTSSSRRRVPPALMGLLIFVAVVVVLRGLVVETFTVPSDSMTPTLRDGDRIAVLKFGAIHRGDVIVFDGDEAWGGQNQPAPATGIAGAIRSFGRALGIRPGETDYVKRVIGIPGDHLVVGKDGVLRRNGDVMTEPYLSGGSASATPFDITVPPGRYFVMGDNRAHSDDSRNHLGDPGGGSIREQDVIGKVVLRFWPIGSWGRLPS